MLYKIDVIDSLPTQLPGKRRLGLGPDLQPQAGLGSVLHHAIDVDAILPESQDGRGGSFHLEERRGSPTAAHPIVLIPPASQATKRTGQKRSLPTLQHVRFHQLLSQRPEEGVKRTASLFIAVEAVDKSDQLLFDPEELAVLLESLQHGGRDEADLMVVADEGQAGGGGSTLSQVEVVKAPGQLQQALVHHVRQVLEQSTIEQPPKGFCVRIKYNSPRVKSFNDYLYHEYFVATLFQVVIS